MSGVSHIVSAWSAEGAGFLVDSTPKCNSQYPPISIHAYRKCHDRFLIIDGTDVWHIGASLKDLGKKMFAFSRLDIPATAITALL